MPPTGSSGTHVDSGTRRSTDWRVRRIRQLSRRQPVSIRTPSIPVWRRPMSRRLDTTECSRSASASDRRAERLHIGGGPLDVGAQEARCSLRLMFWPRRPEGHVRHRGEQGVTALFASANAAADAAWVWSRGAVWNCCSWGDECAQQPSVLGRERTPRHRESIDRSRARPAWRLRRASTGAGSPGDAQGCATRRSSVRARRQSRGPGSVAAR